jgi:CrcB protein
MRETLSVAVAGALGSVSRYAVARWLHGLTGGHWPWGTLAVNVLGCLAIGFVMQLGVTTDWPPRPTRIAVTAGFLGGFTTFSAFGYETIWLMQHGAWRGAALNVTANLVLGGAAVLLGMAAGRAVVVP